MSANKNMSSHINGRMVKDKRKKIALKKIRTIVDDTFVDIELEHENTHYKGWVQPSEKKNPTGMPTSFHVVLNNVFFGNLSYSQDKWVADDQRPDDLVQAVGRRIEKHFPV